MFLVPLTPSSATLPGKMSGPGGNASVTYADDQPVFGTEGSARFAIRRRRRLPWAKRDAEIIPSTPAGWVGRRLRAGDIVELTLGDKAMSWRYAPNANLGRASRIVLATAKVGTVLVGLAFAETVVSELAWYAEQAVQSGGSAKSSALGREIRMNASKIYPAAETKPSAYVQGLVHAKAAYEDLRTFSERWVAEHPQPDATEAK